MNYKSYKTRQSFVYKDKKYYMGSMFRLTEELIHAFQMGHPYASMEEHRIYEDGRHEYLLSMSLVNKETKYYLTDKSPYEFIVEIIFEKELGGRKCKPFGWGIYPEVQSPETKYFKDFEYNGKKYFLNSVVKLTEDAKEYLKSENIYTQVVEHLIDCNGIEKWTYVSYFGGDKRIYHSKTHIAPDDLIEEVTMPAELVEGKRRRLERYKDSEVPEVINGWIIYLFVMLVAVIFYARGVIWFFASIIFFPWRAKKLTKPQRHDYGFEGWNKDEWASEKGNEGSRKDVELSA